MLAALKLARIASIVAGLALCSLVATEAATAQDTVPSRCTVTHLDAGDPAAMRIECAAHPSLGAAAAAAAPDAFERAVIREQSIRPDDRPGLRGAVLGATPSHLATGTAASEPKDSFNWNDAAVGAAVTFLIASALAATLIAVRRGRTITA